MNEYLPTQGQLHLAVESPKPIVLRDYQSEIIHQWRESLDDYKDTLLVAPTGSGKTLISASIINAAVSEYQWRVLFVVHRDALVGQTYKALQSVGVDCGFIKAGWEENLYSKVQVASCQTMSRRRRWKRIDFDLIIYDEAHLTSWTAISKDLNSLYPGAYTLGLTATPWRLSKKQGMGDKFENLIHTPLYKKLIRMGYLVPGLYYSLPEADISDARTQKGDWVESDLALKCDRPEFVDGIVSEWHRLAKGLRSISFAINIEHAQHIYAAFAAAGVSSAIVIGSTPREERKRIYKELAEGRVKVLSSVGCLTEGFDVPSVECIILARPTKSKALYFQMVGRGFRIYEAKNRCLILDQGGNAKRFGKVEGLTKRGISLKKGRESNGDPVMKTCGSRGPDVNDNHGCSNLMYAFEMKCRECGYLFPPKECVQHKGHLELLLDDDEAKEYKAFQTGLKDAFSGGIPFSVIKDRHKKVNGEELDVNWSFGALFGPEPSLTNAIKLMKFCEDTGDHEYRSMFDEFGWDWQTRMKEAKAIFEERKTN